MVIGFDIKMTVKISSIEIVFKSWGPLSHPFFMHNSLSPTGARDMAVVSMRTGAAGIIPIYYIQPSLFSSSY